MKLDYEKLMDLAILEAKKAKTNKEVPVGAILVNDEGIVLASSFNKKEMKHDVTSHAEIEVIREYSKKINNWRLSDLTLIVTLSPCLMCLGAIRDARIKRVVIGAVDDNLSANEQELIDNIYFENKIELIKGIKEKECKKLLNKSINSK